MLTSLLYITVDEFEWHIWPIKIAFTLKHHITIILKFSLSVQSLNWLPTKHGAYLFTFITRKNMVSPSKLDESLNLNEFNEVNLKKFFYINKFK